MPWNRFCMAVGVGIFVVLMLAGCLGWLLSSGQLPPLDYAIPTRAEDALARARREFLAGLAAESYRQAAESYRQAAESYRQAIALAPDHPAANLEFALLLARPLSWSFRHSSDRDAYFAEAQRLQEANAPQLELLRLWIAELPRGGQGGQLESEGPQRVASGLRTYLRRRPDSAAAHASLASTCWNDGDFAAAHNHLTTARRLDSQSALVQLVNARIGKIMPPESTR